MTGPSRCTKRMGRSSRCVKWLPLGGDKPHAESALGCEKILVSRAGITLQYNALSEGVSNFYTVWLTCWTLTLCSAL